MKPIIDPEEVKVSIEQGEAFIFIDARTGPTAKENYQLNHIAGAHFADVDENFTRKNFDPSRGGRHPLPDIKNFGAFLGSIGIRPTSRVIVYDDKGGANAAARVWWMLKAAGHQLVQVLNGGLNAAIASKIPFSNVISELTPAPVYTFSEWQLPTITIEEVESVKDKPNYLVVDVRDAYRYRGESEPIDPVAGHIPGAINIPFSINLTPDGYFLSSDELREKYSSFIKNIPPNQVIVHCGSGVTACHTLLALEHAGIHGSKLFVGSWSEWCRSGKEIATEVR